MSVYHANPNPVLVINDETGEFVMTANITKVVTLNNLTRVYVRSDGNYAISPLTPKELYQRLFDLGE